MFQPKTKTCQNCQTNFVIEPEDFEFYQKIDVPEPTWCPECRAQRRFAWRNERSLYKRKCDFSNKEIFSQFSSNAPVKVYERDIWWSDKWDPMDYGRDYDFDQPFFEQFKELIKQVPWASRAVFDNINSDYCFNASFLKNCYFVFGAGNSENCAYGNYIGDNKECYDCSHSEKCELCYQIFMVNNCYKAFFSSYCDDCQEIIFCHNCVNCSDCFGCANLKHKKYHIFNKPYSEKEYRKKLEEFKIGSQSNILSLLKESRNHHLEFPKKFMHGRHNNNVSGDYIHNSKNVFNSYMAYNCVDVKHCQFVIYSGAQNVYDSAIVGWNANTVYESISIGKGLNQVKFCFECWPDCRDIEYCLNCHSCSDCFACVGLKHKQYCILNKQYSKEEYREMIGKIKQQMDALPYKDQKGNLYKYGEFFPSELSPFAYNETIAQEYFPLTKEQALKQGYRWYDKPKPEYTPTLQAQDIKDNITDIDESILKEVIACGNEPNHTCQGSGVFRLIPPEYEFYQKHHLPIPRLCPDCRHQERIKQRNPMKLWHRQCMNTPCPNEFETTYAPEIVYCESCYQKEVE